METWELATDSSGFPEEKLVGAGVDVVVTTRMAEQSISASPCFLPLPGKKNVVTDCFSRMPIDECPEEVSMMSEIEVEAFSIDGELTLKQEEWENAMAGTTVNRTGANLARDNKGKQEQRGAKMVALESYPRGTLSERI
ncbi:hypothetical protein NDU88_000804 [Pleurodeles waltl]|uniref:Uncharacterized protein n=1 Tax=Pleurodeles waltl TaxID=8319 RepID=A0AAV7Q1C8_PLEWA|nr:hypothetical protein NDU88_000804 [Pleurodeles waltl]